MKQSGQPLADGSLEVSERLIRELGNGDSDSDSYRQNSTKLKGPATLNVHNLCTRVVREQDRSGVYMRVKTGSNVVKSSYALIVQGHQPDVNLPQFKYQDPMIVWTSDICDAGPILESAVQHKWRKACEKNPRTFHGSMAPFRIYLSKDQMKFECMKVNFAGRTACIDSDHYKKCEYGCLLNIWSHDPRIGALLSHILEREYGQLHLDKISERLRNNWWFPKGIMQDECVNEMLRCNGLTDSSKLPMSFKYPTLGISFSILPPPNQAGVLSVHSDKDTCSTHRLDGCLVRKNDNRAHLRVATCIHKVNRLDGYAVVELIQAYERSQHRTLRIGLFLRAILKLEWLWGMMLLSC